MPSVRRVFSYLVNPTTRIRERDNHRENPGSSGPDAEAVSPRAGLKVSRVLLNLPLTLGFLLVAGLFVVVLLGPRWSSQDPFISTIPIVPYWDSEKSEMVTPPFAPSEEYPLGTDQWGNDMLSLLLHGARVTLVVAFYITLLRFGLGLILGGLAGWRADQLADRLVMGLVATVTAVPLLLSGMVLILALDIQKGPIVFIIALAAVGWTEIAQYVRGELIVIRRQPYIEAAEATGLTELQTLVRHALPNILPQLLVVAALEMGAALLLLAELAFIGIFVGGESRFTVDPVFGGGPVPLMEIPEWGVLVAQGRTSIRSNPHLIIGPALAFFVAILGLNLFGEGLRRLLDRTTVNTGFLLTRRMFFVVVAIVALSYALISLTGPKQSFARAASEFRGDLAFEHVKSLFQLAQTDGPAGGEGSAQGAYIADKFREYGLHKGYKAKIFSSYFYEQDETKHVMGFWPGYDINLADEFIVVLARHGSTSEPTANERLSAVAVMLETVRVLDRNQLDPRRSLLFISWSDDPIEPEELKAFLENEENFTSLPIPSNETNHLVAVIQIDYLGNGGDVLWADPEADDNLKSLLARSASAAGVELTSDERALIGPFSSGQSDLPSLYFRWSDPSGGALHSIIDEQKLVLAGEVLTRLLLEIVRPPKY
ncbi:MAG: ABC transporter permease subunit [Chloroflexota bacterium]|nr:MAG: ABC transporter permease subunit [Chloroflexota bacterium]